ncbi:MAG: hypothetical protein AAGL08_05385 [Cyanobacteria bacterium J06573_11]
MGFYRFQLKLWIVSLAGLGWLWASVPAIAQLATEGQETTEAVASHRSGHNCVDLATEQPEPMGDFRQAVMETAMITARAVDTAAEQSDLLTKLSRAYACLGQMEIANEIAREARLLIEQIEDTETRARRLIDLADVYGKKLGDDTQMHMLLDSAIALIELSAENPSPPYELVYAIQLYVETGNYQKIRELIDLFGDHDNISEFVQERLFYLKDTVPESEWLTLLELFPGVAEMVSAIDQAQAEFTPWQIWQSQLHRFMFDLQEVDGITAVNELITTQVSTIEQLPDSRNQVLAYIEISESLSRNNYNTQALSLLEIATEKAALLETTTVPADNTGLPLDLLINSKLSVAFAAAGDFEHSFGLLQEMNTADLLFGKIWALNQITQTRLSDGPLQDQLVVLIAETEQAARQSEKPEQFLLQVADIYEQTNELGSARRLANEVLDTYGETVRVDSELSEHLISVLFMVGNYDQGLELLDTVDSDSYIFHYLPGQLLSENQPEVAWQVFEKITHPWEQIYVLQDMIEEYRVQEQHDLAFELSERALAIAQSDSFNRVDYIESLYEDFGVSYFASASEEEREALMYNTYQATISNIIYLQERPDDQRRLIEQITDARLRENMTAALFGTGITDNIQTETAETATEVVQDDDYWRSEALAAAREDRFMEAIDAIAQIESSAQQSRTLLTIATCYAYSTTPLEAATGETLTQIQQRSSSPR